MFYVAQNSHTATTTATVSSTVTTSVASSSNSADPAILVSNPAASVKSAILDSMSNARSIEVSDSDKLSKNVALAPATSCAKSEVKPEGTDLSETETNMMCRKLYEEELAAMYRANSRLTKPEWTRDRVNKIIDVIEGYKVAPDSFARKNNNGYHYSSKYDVMTLGDQKILILKRSSDQETFVRVVPSDEYFDILSQVHIATGHGGRDKILTAIKSEYVIPTPAIVIFCKHCKVCYARKKNYRFQRSATKNYKFEKNVTIPKIMNHRGKTDFIDMRKIPDGEYNWILHYQDGVTNFSFLRALKSDSLDDIASELLKLFLEIGCPPILETTRSRTFTAAIIEKIESAWPMCKILNGKHKDDNSFLFGDQIEEMLKAWMCEMKSDNWSLGIYFVQFKKNTILSNKRTESTPFQILFGRDPKIGVKNSQLNSIIAETNTEEELEKLVYQLKNRQSDSLTHSSQNGGSAHIKESAASNNHEMGDTEVPSTSSSVIKEEQIGECQEMELLQSTAVPFEKQDEPEIKTEDIDDINTEDESEIKIEDIDDINIENESEIKMEDIDDIKTEDESEIKIDDIDNIKTEPEPLGETLCLDSSEDDDCVITDIKQELEIEICVDEEGSQSKRLKVRI